MSSVPLIYRDAYDNDCRVQALQIEYLADKYGVSVIDLLIRIGEKLSGYRRVKYIPPKGLDVSTTKHLARGAPTTDNDGALKDVNEALIEVLSRLENMDEGA